MAIVTHTSASDAQSAVLADLPAALAGDEAAARRYARAWHALVRELLVGRAEAPSAAADVLDHLALTAPFAPEGPLRALMSAAGGIIPAMTGSVPATAPSVPDTLSTNGSFASPKASRPAPPEAQWRVAARSSTSHALRAAPGGAAVAERRRADRVAQAATVPDRTCWAELNHPAVVRTPRRVRQAIGTERWR
jgi:hypothetical protein